MLGISIKEHIGIGDKLQFSSLPENYFRKTGEKLIDVSRSWIFDHNPFVLRDREPSKVIELWNWPKTFEWPKARRENVYLSNAEIWASRFDVPVVLNRPRLYLHEKYPFEDRWMILFHAHGRSHGALPEHVMQHIMLKYKNTGSLIHLRGPDDPEIGLPYIQPKSLWECAEVISKARMFIGGDSGPSWIAACYPDVISKKVRLKFQEGFKPMQDWVPLEVENHHSHWDDRVFSIYNSTEDDVGFMPSYKRL